MSRGGSDDAPIGAWPRTQPLQIPELLTALNDAGVDYVVIGGYALSAHRYVRGTEDLDIVPEPVRENLERLVAVAETIDGVPTDIAGGLRERELPAPFGIESLMSRGSWALNTRFGVLHIMQEVAGAENYDELRANAKTVPVPQVGEVRFVGRDQLIRMKKASPRLKDQADVEELLKRGGG